LPNFDGTTEHLPFSLEAEQALLGSVLVDSSCFTTILARGLKDEHFYLPQHRAIFLAFHELFNINASIDPVIVLDTLKKAGVYDDAGGKTYLFKMSQLVPSTANVEQYCEIVLDKYYSRTLITVSQEIISQASNESGDAGSLLDMAEQRIYDIRKGKEQRGLTHIKGIIINEVYDRLNKLSSDQKEQYLGISCGISDVDKITTGFNKSDLIILGARPGMGKTSLALNFCRNVAVQSKKRVAFFSLEMTNAQLTQRMLSSEAGIPSTKMRTGDLTQSEWSRLATASDILSACEIYFDDTSGITVPEMKAKLRRMRDVDLVIVDYLGLMNSAKKIESRVQEVSEITRSLKLMAKDLNVPVIACAQLSRGTETRGKSHKPQLSDLRESGSIEQDADIVMFIYRDIYYHADNKAEEADVNAAELIVAKNRHGAVEEVPLHFEPQFTKFTSVAKFKS
jgi:replicative DNA helicase